MTRKKSKRTINREAKERATAAKVRARAGDILHGTLFCVDPATGARSMPGYAIYKKGELYDSGYLQVSGGSTEERLRSIYDCLAGGFADVEADVLAVEMIRPIAGKFAPQVSLVWSCCIPQIAIRAPVIEIGPMHWQRVAKDEGYEKTDENDAIYIGRALIEMAGEYL